MTALVFVLVRRPEDGLLGGLWSFPGEVARDGESVEDAAMRVARAASGLATVGRGRPVGTVAHVFSHRREVYHVFLFAVPATGADGEVPHHEQVESCGEPAGVRGDRVEPRHEEVPLGRGRTALRSSQAAPRRGRVARRADGGQRVTSGGGARGVWVAPEELERYALPSAQRRILRLVQEE